MKLPVNRPPVRFLLSSKPLLDVGRGPWRTGPPPSIGWWPADIDTCKDTFILRWWDGKNWSSWYTQLDSLSIYSSPKPLPPQWNMPVPRILWRQRATFWPKNSLT